MTTDTTPPENPPKTPIDHLKSFGAALLIVGLTFLMLELAVRFTDPWGLSFFNDLLKMGNQTFELDPVRGYKIMDGTHHFSHWRMSVEDGARLTPDTNTSASCTIVLLGDSVTMAHGVNDDETWANQLALRFPDIHFINAGVTTYNSVNVRGTKAAFPSASAYIYTLVDNDIADTVNPDPEAFPGQNPTRLPYLVRYTNFIMFGRRARAEIDQPSNSVAFAENPRMDRLVSDVDSILEGDDTWIVSFESYPLAHELIDRGYDIPLYDYPDETISLVDSHLNPQGNIEYANQLTPLIETIFAENCSE